MANSARLTGMLKRGAIGLALWTAFGVLWAMPSMLGADTSTGGLTLWDAADHIIVFYWAWALVTPVVLLVARRASRSTSRRVQLTALVVAGAPIVIVLQGLLYYALVALLNVIPVDEFDISRLLSHLARHSGGDLATYFMLVGVYLLVDANRRAREGDVVAAQLEGRLARADAELLRSQLQPHFLFNALNTVSTLVLKAEVEQANRAIELVSRYLRDALAQRSEAPVTLEAELATVRRYVDIEKLRFGDALQLEIDVPGDALTFMMPGSLIQPLVENAVRHGVAAANGGGAVAIAARVDSRGLHVTVSDPGHAAAAGEPANHARSPGFGLHYVTERIRQRFGTEASFHLSVSPHGTVATLDLPASTS